MISMACVDPLLTPSLSKLVPAFIIVFIVVMDVLLSTVQTLMPSTSVTCKDVLMSSFEDFSITMGAGVIGFSLVDFTGQGSIFSGETLLDSSSKLLLKVVIIGGRLRNGYVKLLYPRRHSLLPRKALPAAPQCIENPVRRPAKRRSSS